MTKEKPVNRRQKIYARAKGFRPGRGSKKFKPWRYKEYSFHRRNDKIDYDNTKDFPGRKSKDKK